MRMFWITLRVHARNVLAVRLRHCRPTGLRQQPEVQCVWGCLGGEEGEGWEEEEEGERREEGT